MPTIDVRDQLLDQLVGRHLTDQELEPLLSTAKAALEEHDEASGIRRVELKDTNRPDLWSTAGLARHIRVYLGGSAPDYDFVSTGAAPLAAGDRIVEVDSSLQALRPFIAAFALSGPPLSEPQLLEIIQSQEKLSENFGQRRRAIAVGIYRANSIQYPVRYQAYAPTARRFVPLGDAAEMTLADVLVQHPKGRQYAHLVRDLDQYPFLEDASGNALSMPPIINSNDLGAVQVGDSELFVEFTGLHLEQLLLAAAIAACDLADAGYTIHPVLVRYPYDTPYGREIVCPLRFQTEATAKLADASRLLGDVVGADEAIRCVQRMGSTAVVDGDVLQVTPPVFRNDFLHAVDVVEEIAIGRGLASFKPELPRDFTVGALSSATLQGRRVREALVGLGYQEMVFYYLASMADMTTRMNRPAGTPVALANPLSESFAVLRDSNLPYLLAAERASQNAAYPHLLFEVGKAVVHAPADATGTRTFDILGMLIADRTAGFNEVRAHLSALLYYLSPRAFELQPLEDPRYLPGRAASVVVQSVVPDTSAPAAAVGARGTADESVVGTVVRTVVGTVGEIHPQVLENWGIQMPCAAAEIDLSTLWTALRKPLAAD
jgi:phenylalanyl-tRNA synthetase beta chain